MPVKVCEKEKNRKDGKNGEKKRKKIEQDENV